MLMLTISKPQRVSASRDFRFSSSGRSWKVRFSRRSDRPNPSRGQYHHRVVGHGRGGTSKRAPGPMSLTGGSKRKMKQPVARLNSHAEARMP